jgi:hypothetical protein
MSAMPVDDSNVALHAVDGLHAPSADGNPVTDNLCATTGGAIGGEGNGANVLVAPVAVSGEIVLLVDGGFGWPICGAGLGNDGGALAAGGTHITGAARDNSGTLGSGGGLRARVGSKAPSEGGGDNVGVDDFAKVAGSSLSTGIMGDNWDPGSARAVSGWESRVVASAA